MGIRRRLPSSEKTGRTADPQSTSSPLSYGRRRAPTRAPISPPSEPMRALPVDSGGDCATSRAGYDARSSGKYEMWHRTLGDLAPWPGSSVAVPGPPRTGLADPRWLPARERRVRLKGNEGVREQLVETHKLHVFKTSHLQLCFEITWVREHRRIFNT